MAAFRLPVVDPPEFKERRLVDLACSVPAQRFNQLGNQRRSQNRMITAQRVGQQYALPRIVQLERVKQLGGCVAVVHNLLEAQSGKTGAEIEERPGVPVVGAYHNFRAGRGRREFVEAVQTRNFLDQIHLPLQVASKRWNLHGA